MVQLASIDHKGTTKLVARIDNGEAYVDLSSIAPNARAFFEKGETAIAEANALINGGEHKIPASETRLLIPLDPSTCGKFLCIGERIQMRTPTTTRESVVASKYWSHVLNSFVLSTYLFGNRFKA